MLRINQVMHMEASFVALFLLLRPYQAAVSRRSLWRRPRHRSFLSDIAGGWTDAEWKRNFRVNRSTFVIICRELRGRLIRSSTVRPSLSVEQRVAISLWRLGTNVEYRTISHLFGVGISTVCVVLHEFCRAVVDGLSGYVSVPTGAKLRAIRDGFKTKWGFPQCIGAIDGTHIPIIAPKEHPTDYFNRKGYHSILVQALVDDQYRFLDIYTGWPGSVHDARVLGNSKLYQKCEAGTFLPNWDAIVGNTTIPLLILGDPAYPLRPWLMKPFTGTGLTQKQRKFNYHLSRSRVVVENAFGRLKGRWRTLMKRNDNDIKYILPIIMTCCILHNICENQHDLCEDEWLVRSPTMSTDSEDSSTTPSSSSSASTTSGQSGTVIRDALCDYFDML